MYMHMYTHIPGSVWVEIKNPMVKIVSSIKLCYNVNIIGTY